MKISITFETSEQRKAWWGWYVDGRGSQDAEMAIDYAIKDAGTETESISHDYHVYITDEG